MRQPPSSRRRHLAGSLLACVWLLAATAATASDEPASRATAALTARIDAHIGQPRFAAASWGIAVVSLDSGRTLYTHRADQLLQPASTAKLFTAALGLSTLGASYRLPTRLLGTGRIRHGRLDGSLILYGMGDPTLGTGASSDWAEQLVAQLVARGIRRVHGDLIADDSYFAGPAFGSGWEAGDLQSWFAMPASALSVQENTVGVTLTPGAATGLPARLDFDPVDAKPAVSGQLRTGAPHTPSDINLYRAPGASTLQAFGSLAVDAPPQHFRLAVIDPALLAGAQLRQALTRHGIRVSGTLRVLHWPQDDAALLAHAELLAEVQSPPLLDILQQGLKRSQNLYLQNVWLSVGAHEQRAGVSAATTTATGFVSTERWAGYALQRLLMQLDIAPSAVLLEEGSGLSRRDLVTPNALARVLVYLAAQPYADGVRAALPTAAVDGTLGGRMRDTAAADNVQAKTGSMTYVHCLAGYVTSAAGERLAFAIMLNNYESAPAGPSANSDVDAIAVLLATYATSSTPRIAPPPTQPE
jgi:D-alanyl-D-alanine carboxypeptidase/D-alanyl-D-alanine-endopeptidase (penicillin-binding protein 4)